MTQTILAFGDSNTHGTPPMPDRGHHARLPRRWPVVLQEITGHTVIEDGLPGRTACPISVTSPDMHRDGHIGLRMALYTHGPIDHLLIMLGSNDFKESYGRTVDQIIAGLAGLITLSQDAEAQARHNGFATTLICPPELLEVGSFVPEFRGASAKSRALAPDCAALTAAWNIGFLDAGQHITSSITDGVHFDSKAHETLGHAIAAQIFSKS